MPISKETKERIAQDGRKHWLNTSGDQGELDYIAGAEAEAERVLPLLDAVGEWLSFDNRIFSESDLGRMEAKIKKEFANYNSKPVK